MSIDKFFLLFVFNWVIFMHHFFNTLHLRKLTKGKPSNGKHKQICRTKMSEFLNPD